MPQWQGTTDTTSNNLPNYGSQGIENYRPLAATTYQIGAVLQIVPVDQQVAPDFMSVQLCAAGASVANCAGVVSPAWAGFSPSDGFVNTSGNETLVRGTQFIKAAIKGASPILLDHSGTGAVTVVNGSPLIGSAATAGYAQGASRAVAISGGSQVIATALLPSTGIGSSLTAAALAQAAQTITIAGTPAAGDVITVTIQAPYTSANPGVAQTIAYAAPALTTAQAASVTTAALAVLTYLNAQPSFSQYFTATQAAGVITITVNALSTPFLVTYGSGTTVTGQLSIGISGMVANSLTIATSVSAGAGSTSTAGGANFASGTGYKGLIPALIEGEF